MSPTRAKGKGSGFSLFNSCLRPRGRESPRSVARKTRVYLPGALYHVIARGNLSQRIFRSDADRRRYLELLDRGHGILARPMSGGACVLAHPGPSRLVGSRRGRLCGTRTGHFTLTDVARRYRRDQVTVSLGIKRLRERMAEESELRRSAAALVQQIREAKLNN